MTMLLPAWQERPRELANLLNPAFTSLVLSRSVSSYAAARQEGLPLPLGFLILPIILHPQTRDALPRASTTTMYGWLAEHAHLKALFPERARATTPFTQEALRFALSHEKFSLDAAALHPGRNRYSLTAVPRDATPDVETCLNKAGFLGRWFASIEAPATILAAWGVRP